jgi:hypothetical protein
MKPTSRHNVGAPTACGLDGCQTTRVHSTLCAQLGIAWRVGSGLDFGEGSR